MARDIPIQQAPINDAGPQSAFRMHDRRFADVLGDAPRLDLVVAVDAHEGPVYVAGEDALYLTSVPRSGPGRPEVAIRRLALNGGRFPLEEDRVSLLRADANAANGMTLGLDGRLLVCEQGGPSTSAAIAVLDPSTGAAEPLVDHWRGLPLNSPNDIVVKRDGTVWFTDPSYGHLQGFRPRPRLGDHVYRHDPRTGGLEVVADDFDKPNGIAFSPDERLLYITDSGANQDPGSYDVTRPHHIRVFDVLEGNRLGPGRLFAVTSPGFPDGIKVDAAGRVYASSFDGVQIFSADGELIGEIVLPGAVNFTFGGPDRNILFITADTAVWAAVLHATGPRLPARPHPTGATP